MSHFKYLLVYISIIFAGSIFCFQDLNKINFKSSENFSFQDSVVSNKNNALIILQDKCNDCHLKENKSKIFTLENMDDYAKKINKQVFIKKKMPKDDVTLSEEEYRLLQNWLNDVLNLTK